MQIFIWFLIKVSLHTVWVISVLETWGTKEEAKQEASVVLKSWVEPSQKYTDADFVQP